MADRFVCFFVLLITGAICNGQIKIVRGGGIEIGTGVAKPLDKSLVVTQKTEKDDGLSGYERTPWFKKELSYRKQE